MSVSYEVHLINQLGERFAVLEDIRQVVVARVANEVGLVQVNVGPDLDLDQLQRDIVVDVWRRRGTSPSQRLRAGLLRAWRYRGSSAGDSVELLGHDPNELLLRRVVPFYSGYATAQKTDNADDMMKEIMTENYGSGATDPISSTGRDMSSYLTVAADLGQGPSVTHEFAKKKVLRVLQEIVDLSQAQGTDLYFDIQYQGTQEFEFRTFVDQPGQDFTEGGAPLQFSAVFGNLGAYELEWDYGEEENFIYALGRGTGGGQIMRSVSDSDRINASPYNRREGVSLVTGPKVDADSIDSAGYARLNEYRPRVRLSAELLDSEQFPFGGAWNWGDRVPVVVQGKVYAALVAAYTLKYDENGEQMSVVAKAENVV